MLRKLASAAAIAAFGLGVGAGSASGYSLLGGPYLGSAAAANTATVGGAYTLSCGAVEFSGSATGSATTEFVAAHSDCTYFGFPALVTQSGEWEFTVIGDDGFGTYAGRIDIPAGASSTTSLPITGCTVTVEGPQSISDSLVQVVNGSSGLAVSVSLSGIGYTASGCPFSSGTDLSYASNGPIEVPGVTAS